MRRKQDKWELYKDKREEHRWRRKAANGDIVGASIGGFIQMSDCIGNAERHGMNGNPEGIGMDDRWEIYVDKRREYRWRRKASNRKMVGRSSESYKKRETCKSNAERNGR